MNNTEICKEYGELEIKNNISIKKEDLPGEFGDNAFETINEFIKKTHHLNHEWVMYFDYNTGEILKCGKGENNKVKIDFKDGEFDNFNVASIHNHPQNVFSPPSGKNFKIMEREFEDYELIVGFEYFWILKAKGLHENLVSQMNIASETFFNSTLERCSYRYRDIIVYY